MVPAGEVVHVSMTTGQAESLVSYQFDEVLSGSPTHDASGILRLGFGSAGVWNGRFP